MKKEKFLVLFPKDALNEARKLYNYFETAEKYEINIFTANMQNLQGDTLLQEMKNLKQKIRDFDKNIDDRKYVIMEVI